MKFTVGSHQLSSRLAIISRVIPSGGKSGATSAITNDVLMEIAEGKLRLTGTDGETRLSLMLPIQIEEGDECSVCIRPEHLLLPLKELAPQELTFDIDPETLRIGVRYLNGHFDFVGQDAENYPKSEALVESATSVELPTAVLTRGLSYTDYATSPDTSRPLFGGVHIELEKDLISFAATDGFMMALYKNRTISLPEAMNGGQRTLTLPAKPISLIKMLFTGSALDHPAGDEEASGEGGSPESVRMTIYVNYATFEREDMRLECRLISGKYPNCESVIPKDNDKSIIADRTQLLSAMRRVSIFADDTTKLVNMVLTENQLQLDAKDLGYSTAAQELLPVSYDGEGSFEIAFSAAHFVKILSVLPGEHVELLLGDHAHAAILKPHDADEEGDETVIAVDMPLLL